MWAMQAEALLRMSKLWSVVERPQAGRMYAASVIQGEDELRDASGSAIHSRSSSVGAGNGTDYGISEDSMEAFTILLTSLKGAEMLMPLIGDVPSGNAHELWMRLKRHFTGATIANRMALMAEWETIRQKNGESATMFGGRLKQTIITLASMGKKISTEDAIYRYFTGLSPVFESTVDALLIDSSIANLEDAISRIAVVEARKQLKGGLGGRAPETAHYAGQESKGGNRTPSSSGEPVCFRCQKPGHKRHECPDAPICGSCGKRGHITEKCWGSNGKVQGQGARNARAAAAESSVNINALKLQTAMVAIVEKLASTVEALKATAALQ